MTTWKTSLTLAAALTAGLTTLTTTAQDQAPAAENAEAATGSVSGKLVLPAEAPEGINTEGLEMSNAVVTLEGSFVREPVPYPDNYADMTDQEKQAWAQAFMKSEEYKDYVERARAAYENRPIVEAEVAEDGSFSAEGLTPGDWTLNAYIPHAKADPDMLRYHARAYYNTQVTVEAGGKATDLGDRTFQLKNVVIPGDVAPPWAAQSYEGGEIKLSDFRGKYVLIDFWATWCGPCIAELPNLEAVYKDFGGEKFEMVGLSLDRSIDLPKAFHEENHSPYVHGYLGEWNNTETTARDYGVVGIPSIWLIGPDGVVVARDLRGEELREAVRKAVEGEVGTN